MLASQNAEVSFVFLEKSVAGQKISLSILMVSNQGNRLENTAWDEFTFKGLVHQKKNSNSIIIYSPSHSSKVTIYFLLNTKGYIDSSCFFLCKNHKSFPEISEFPLNLYNRFWYVLANI